MAGRIHRVTMFKIPGADAQKKLIEAYTKMGQDSKKVRCKPIPRQIPKVQNISRSCVDRTRRFPQSFQCQTEPRLGFPTYILSLKAGAVNTSDRMASPIF